MLTKKEEQFLKSYGQPLRLPRWKYVVIYGLTWAFMTMIIVTVITSLFDLENAVWKSWRSILINLVIWLLGGISYGLWSRSIIVRQYNKISAKQQHG